MDCNSLNWADVWQYRTWFLLVVAALTAGPYLLEVLINWGYDNHRAWRIILWQLLVYFVVKVALDHMGPRAV